MTTATQTVDSAYRVLQAVFDAECVRLVSDSHNEAIRRLCYDNEYAQAMPSDNPHGLNHVRLALATAPAQRLKGFGAVDDSMEGIALDLWCQAIEKKRRQIAAGQWPSNLELQEVTP